MREAAVPPPQRGGLAALNFEASKPRIVNAIAVGEMHHTDALSRLIKQNAEAI